MYVLILTIAIKMGYAGMGGVAMQEFKSYSSCKEAATQWKIEVKKRSRIDNSELRALCVKK